MSEQGWIDAVAEAKLRDKKRMVFRHEGRQILLCWVEGQEAQVYALDNRCPHEGYPLLEGTLEEDTCVLTCQWHNWKFDIQSGKCLLGEDHVRVYPTKRADGRIWLDLRKPAPGDQQERILEGLQAAVAERQYGRICRELSRLLESGNDPVIGVQQALAWRSEHFEYGMKHAHAVSADWLALYDESVGDTERQILCLAEAIDHIAEDSLRYPAFPYASDVLPFDGAALLEAIEAEDEAKAIGLVRGGLAAGQGWDSLEPWLVEAALAHYNDFGHAVIYVQKTGALIARLGAQVTEHLVFPLVRSLCASTREDLLPPFRRYAHFLQAATLPGDGPLLQQLEPQALEVLWTASTNEAMAWVNEQLPRVAFPAILTALVEASARNLLMYDTGYQDAYDKPVSQNIGWLDLTHALTFAHAVQSLCKDRPALWPAGLLQMACFVGRNQAYLDRAQATAHWFVAAPDAFWQESLLRICDHGLNAPIFSAHLLKTYLAVRALYTQLPPEDPQSASCGRYLLASLHRFLQSPIKLKHVRRNVRQAMALVGIS